MKWTEEILFNDGDTFFADVLSSIDSAEHSIDFETYIFNRDRIGTKIIQALIKAVARGVKVRLLMDGIGSYDWSHEQVQKLKSYGLDVKVFHPLPWFNPDSASMLIKSWEKLKRRNHRKSILIDHKMAYIGSFNVTDAHSKAASGKNAFRDTAVRVQGPCIEALEKEFQWTWTIADPTQTAEAPVPSKSPGVVRANSSRASRRKLYREFFDRILKAEDHVWLMTAYFVPRVSILYALREAAKRGVDIRILLPSKSDIGPLSKLAHSFYSTLLKNKIRIFEYQPSTLHAKVCLIDDWLVVGSTNLNYRSLVYDYELDIVLSKPETIAQVKEQFNDDFKHSKEIRASKWSQRGLADRFLETLVLPFKNWS